MFIYFGLLIDMSYEFIGHISHLSERLSNILDNVGFSREDRDRKVKAASDMEVLFNIGNNMKRLQMYIFGSRGEGSTGPGLQSDMDMVYCSLNIHIVTDLSQCQPGTNFLMLKDSNSHPGYVKLQLIQTLPDGTYVPAYWIRYVDDYFTTDSLNRVLLLSRVHMYHGTSISGPAIHHENTQEEFSFDRVNALRSFQWPQEGYEWFHRRRPNGWPTPMEIENARKYGCFAATVGHPHSQECNLEFRLSFSITERKLVRSFEDTTMKVYILLKMIRKTFIKPVVGDAFSSYHCKVCMLWMRERLPHEIWRKENTLHCLILCIRQLLEWAMSGECPDYFIVENNIYDRKITGVIQTELVQKLRNILSSNCRFLLEIQCCNLGQYMAGHMVRFDNCIDPIIFEEQVNYTHIIVAAFDCWKAILCLRLQEFTTLVEYLYTIKYARTYLPYSMHNTLKYVQMILCTHIGFHVATMCITNAHTLPQQEVEYLVGLASGFLSFGINSDTASVRLKLCGLGMEFGNPSLIETSIDHISNYHMRYIFSDSMESCFSGDMLYRSRYNTLELLQTLTCFPVVYLPTEIAICPIPLRMEMFRSVGAPSELRDESINYWYDWCVVDSEMCLSFFQYLNFSKQGKYRQKQIAIDRMTCVIMTMHNKKHKETAFNLLGYSYMQEIQLTNAFKCFVKSLFIRPYHNAAKFYLGILFNKIRATDRRHR